ncbi:hypothetical protein FQZ97_1269280 [compost metagenome]
MQQIVKLRRGFEHKGHAPFDVSQVGKGIAAKTNGASVLDGTALAGQRQLDGLGGTGGDVSDVGDMVTAQ